MNTTVAGIIVISLITATGILYYTVLQDESTDDLSDESTDDLSIDPNAACPDDLSSCPTELNLLNRTITISQFFIWRNDEPVLPRPSQRLIFIVKIVFTDGNAFDMRIIPNAFILEGNNNQTWEGEFEHMDRPDCGYNCMEKKANEGPNWDGGTLVTPVIEIDLQNEKYHLRGPSETVIIAA